MSFYWFYLSIFKSKGNQAFTVIGPKLLNSLPLYVRSAACLDTCNTRWKTHYYTPAFPGLSLGCNLSAIFSPVWDQAFIGALSQSEVPLWFCQVSR